MESASGHGGGEPRTAVSLVCALRWQSSAREVDLFALSSHRIAPAGDYRRRDGLEQFRPVVKLEEPVGPLAVLTRATARIAIRPGPAAAGLRRELHLASPRRRLDPTTEVEPVLVESSLDYEDSGGGAWAAFGDAVPSAILTREPLFVTGPVVERRQTRVPS